MVGYTYSTFTTELSKLTVIPETDADFLSNLPSAIDYAEQRIYRELDLLATIVQDASQSVTANNRAFTLPSAQGRFVTVTGLNIFTPSTAGFSDGTRNPVMLTTRDYIDFTWPSNTSPSATTTPQFYAMITDQTIIMGPPPGASFLAEVVGTIRPTPLSASNTTTYLSQYLPDLFLSAAMVFMTGYQQNFGQQSDNPQMAQSWESQYGKLLASANVEEVRRKYGSYYSTITPPQPVMAGGNNA
ncbi:MAG TPA: hypothetical protein VI358_18010 [Pseudolabrys sp.]